MHGHLPEMEINGRALTVVKADVAMVIRVKRHTRVYCMMRACRRGGCFVSDALGSMLVQLLLSCKFELIMS